MLSQAPRLGALHAARQRVEGPRHLANLRPHCRARSLLGD